MVGIALLTLYRVCDPCLRAALAGEFTACVRASVCVCVCVCVCVLSKFCHTCFQVDVNFDVWCDKFRLQNFPNEGWKVLLLFFRKPMSLSFCAELRIPLVEDKVPSQSLTGR